MINCKVNGIAVQVAEGATVLEAAKKAHVKIPTLCYNPDLSPWAACGICVVKVEGGNKMLRSCCTPVMEGQSFITNDAELVEIRKT
ncbi:MAG: 2Fe-2S iron-sulfur cluster-binding protein, partial [Spirochaetia bacterium]|nr:2Fe-2S iron-sulfur cluster-binding protein [Spirochaetia bacterium]